MLLTEAEGEEERRGEIEDGRRLELVACGANANYVFEIEKRYSDVINSNIIGSRFSLQPLLRFTN